MQNDHRMCTDKNNAANINKLVQKWPEIGYKYKHNNFEDTKYEN